MITTVCKISYGSQTVPPIVPAVQGDTGRAISFEIADFTPPAGARATYFILKPSGEAIYNSATITDNSILCELTAQSLAEAGENRMQVRVLQGEDIVTSFEVILMVRTFLGDDAMESGTEMNIFDQAVEQAAEEFQTQAEQIVEEVIESIPSDYTALTEEVDELNERIDNEGLSEDAKVALLNCFAHVAWIDEYGQDYYDALEEALNHTPAPVWDYEWVASSAGTLPPGMTVKTGTPSYESATQSLLTNYPDINFEYVGDGVLEMELSCPAESGNNYFPQFHAPIKYDGNGQLREGLVFVNADSNKKIYGTVSGAGQGTTDLNIDQTAFHKYKMEVKNGTCNLYIDDNLVGSGYRISGNAKAFGVASGPVGLTGQYIKFKSIRFKMDTDWFEQMEWCYPGNLTMRGAGAGWVDGAPATYNTKSSPDRASFWVKKCRAGQDPVINDDTKEQTDLYAIPVPKDAVRATVSIAPSSYYVGIRTGIWDSANDTWIAGDQTGWVQGITTLNFTAQENRYITVNSKFNSAGSSGTMPTGIVINFE